MATPDPDEPDEPATSETPASSTPEAPRGMASALLAEAQTSAAEIEAGSDWLQDDGEGPVLFSAAPDPIDDGEEEPASQVSPEDSAAESGPAEVRPEPGEA